MSEINLSRLDLYTLAWSESLTSLAKKYNITPEELRKICKSQSIPLPKSGHWMKLKYGKPVEIVPLSDGNLEIDLKLDKVINIEKEDTPLIKLQKEIEKDPNISLIVPVKLTKPDILVIQARDTFLNPPNHKNGWKSPSGFTIWEVLRISVLTKENLDRALRFMDTLIKALKGRGHQITASRGETLVIIGEEKIKVNFREKKKRIIIKQERWGNSTELIPTGILTFNIEGMYPKEWKDGKQKLEEQLSGIIAKLELEGHRLKEQTEYHRKYQAEQAEKRRIELEIRQKAEKEQQNFKDLLQSALKHRETIMLREYITAIEKKAESSGKLDEKMKEWIIWARKRADSNDPLLAD